ncbi:hypothetical protein H4R26_003164 [Coemansia thaxteri]|uniref:Uncharacterized protein n=1 Tax=Coemansia thaxteri TaxID=2663907 RepID=A0A9W8EF98_9FUNG|nr:hypothetical protein H4R26_003164 [Coemansia thaxteri]KAJ2484020.1 hypothetical protein EV174_002774 [Coemansia sp. RSA 2320]
MWNQVILLAGALGLGYYLATRGPSAQGTEPPSDESASAAGAFPVQNTQQPAADSNNSEHLSSKSKNKKKKDKGKTRTLAKQSPPPHTEEEAALLPSAQATTVYPSQPADENGDDASDNASNEEAEWEAVDSASAARPAKRKSVGIPTHQSAWSGLAAEEDLSRPAGPAAPARVLRIGAAAQQAAAPRMRREYTAPEPLTRKQRQNLKKAERQRELRAHNADVQDHRLRQHQVALTDLRSREQWARAKRDAARAPPAKSGSTATASVIEGKLVWD